MSEKQEQRTNQVEGSKAQPSEELKKSSNDSLDVANSDFIGPSIKLAREQGDSKRAHLLSQRERAISDMALNPEDAPFGGNERRLMTGAMADALDVYITDMVQFEGEGGEGVENAEKLFRELGKDLFGEASRSVDAAPTTLEQVQLLFDNIPDTSSLRSLRENLRMDLELIDEDGGVSKMAQENPADLKARLERTQLLLAQSLTQSNDIVEQMRMDGEMTAQEANEKFTDAYQVMRGLHKLQGLIDGLEQKAQEDVGARERKVKVEGAKAEAETAVNRAEGRQPDVVDDQLENEKTASLVGAFVEFLVEEEARDVEESKKRGRNLARQYGQFADVFPQMYPGVSSGETFRRIAEEIRTKKEEAKKTLKPEQRYAADAIAQRIAVRQMLDEMSVQYPEVVRALQEALNDEGDRQRKLFEDTGIGGAIIQLSPERFLATLYEQLSQKGLV